MRETIAAIATAPGRAGVAVVRISGDNAFDVARAVARKVPEPGRFAFARFRDADGETIDEGLVLAFKAPASYTGEDVAELQCHGGAAAPRRVLAAAISAGARLARPGEFTQRAFLSGKIPLEKAQSIIDLIDAKTDRAAKAAISPSADGELAAIYDAALALSAEIEHSIDIDEGELPEDFVAGVRSRADGILEKTRAAARRLREKRMLLGGALVVLAGPVNAGKSSLFNALAGSERAIVSAIPGTTRDSVETWLDIEGWPVRLVDTAGIRGRGADEVEDEGIRRAKALAEEADVVVSLGGDVPPGKPTIKTWPKCDLSRGEGLCVSAATGEGIEELKKAIAARLEALADGAGLADGERSDGRIAALLNAAAILGGTVEILDGGGEDSLVLAGNDLRRVCDTLAPFTGGDWTGDMIAALFSRFCVGK